MRIDITKGIKNSRLKHFEPILSLWIRANEHIGQEWVSYYEDVPWWYNERATLSVLAGSIWSSGGWAFEEFSTTKRVKRKGKSVEIAGRCDINFEIGAHEYVAEAKQSYPILKDITRAVEISQATLSTALKSAKELHGWYLIPKLGIAFISPRIHISKDEQIDSLLGDFLRKLLKLSNVTVAWCFPVFGRRIQPQNINQRYYYPGIVTLIKKAT